jgi:hypothetical protein
MFRETVVNRRTARLLSHSIRYTHAVLRSVMRQALQWRLLLENPADGVKVPQQPRNEMQALTVYLGRDHETNKRNYRNRTLHGSMREAQAYLTRKLRERVLGRDLEGAKITLNEYLDRWIQTDDGARSVRSECRPRSYRNS